MKSVTPRFTGIVLIALAVTLPAAANLNVETIEATHPTSEREGNEAMEYEFPLVSGDSAAASQINTFLHAVELQKLPGRYARSPFEEVWPGMEPPYAGMTGISFSVKANQPGFLSVDIYHSYIAAYPSSGVRSYNFDARTGEPIDLHRIFTSEGMALLREQVARSRLQRIDDFLAGKEMDEYGTMLSDDPEIAADQKRLYSECREFVAEDDLAYDELGLRDKVLVLSRESCGGHSQRAIAELGNFDNEFPYGTLKPWLNPYGLCLLVELRTDCRSIPVGIEAGVYRGEIDGRYPVTLVVERSDPRGALSAMYFYDKYAKQIALSATRQKDGSVHFEESGPPPARFSLRWVDGAIKGAWTPEGKSPLSVELK